MDPIANLIELDAIYNHILDGLLAMKIVHEAWKSAQDKVLHSCKSYGRHVHLLDQGYWIS